MTSGGSDGGSRRSPRARREATFTRSTKPGPVLPLGHAAFAYLTYVAVAAATDRNLPARWALVPLAVGSQFPDLIDKPLAFYGLLASGRSMGHSVFVAAVLVGGVAWRVRASGSSTRSGGWRHRLATVAPGALAVGYATHLVGDVLAPVLAGRLWDARFLLWPLASVPRSPVDDVSPLVRLLRQYQQPTAHPQIELIALAATVFVLLRVRRARSGMTSANDG
jgi:hypothetical protein